ncbi:hypothetical protein [Bradyrhizobium sp. BR 1433]|uniref:hypothetical protein n=1 Tax=Bradyrhizobium sp. BR 1433 TaxID=3447967 RepID=UPI003EE57C7E
MSASVCELAFGKTEIPQRRSGAVDGDAGGRTAEDQSNKMAKTADRNKQCARAITRSMSPAFGASIRRARSARRSSRQPTKIQPAR